MFKKPLTVKSNVQLRGSEKKALKARLKTNFTLLSAEEVDELIKTKSDVTTGKLATDAGVKVTTINVDRCPLLFSLDESPTLFPTVYLLWRYPHIVPMFLVDPSVLKKLENGADVMLPGLLHLGRSPGEPVSAASLGNVAKGGAASIGGFSSTGGLDGPRFVARALLSAQDFVDSAFKGRGFQILHMHQDCLWELGPRTNPPATILDTELFLSRLTLGKEVADDADGTSSSPNMKDQASRSKEQDEEESGESEEEDDPEEVLTQCFLLALKTRLTKSDLPILVSAFWAEGVIRVAKQLNLDIDVKRTRHKQVGAFVREMGDRGYVDVREEKRGVDVITAVAWAKAAEDTFLELPDQGYGDASEEDSTASLASGPQVAELLSVTALVLPIFRAVDANISKGSCLQPSRVKTLVQEYAKAQQLPSANGKVQLDPQLSDVLATRDTEAKWVDLLNAFQTKMTRVHRITFPDGRSKEIRGAVPLVKVAVGRRAGNKMVTTVDNLSVFGIRPEDFAQRAKTGIAASATLLEPTAPNQGSQVLIQGNQVAFVGKELAEFYNIPSKFTSGLDLAVKKKGKGKRK